MKYFDLLGSSFFLISILGFSYYYYFYSYFFPYFYFNFLKNLYIFKFNVLFFNLNYSKCNFFILRKITV